MNHHLPWLCVLLILVARVDGQARTGSEYDGRYRGTARLRSCVGELPKLRKAALATISRRLGLRPRQPGRICIELADARPDPGQRLRRFTGPPFTTRTEGARQDAPIVVTLRVEYLLNGTCDVPRVVTHEMTHAVMRELMPAERYRAVPKWVREGLALWVAEQGHERTEHWIRTRPQAADGEWLYPGLESGRHDLQRYPEDFAATAFIETKAGRGGVRRFAKEVVKGRACHDAVKEVTGLAWEEFRSGARRHGLEQLARCRPRGWGAYRKLYVLNRKRKWSEVTAGARAFLQEHRKSALFRDVHYWLGKALRLQKKPEDAMKVLRPLAEGRLGPSPWIDLALYQLASVQLDAGRPAKAQRTFELILEEHPGSTVTDRALFGIARCLAARKKTSQALGALALFSRSFPKNSLRSQVRALEKKLRSQ